MKKHFTLSLLFALVLTFIGGFVELYSVKVRGIYAAMQTGNLIYIFTNLIDQNYQLALNNAIVVILFFCGCFIGEVIRVHLKGKVLTFENLALILQAIFLVPAIAIPANSGNWGLDITADAFLALFGAMQLCAFQSENGNFYVSTMMTIVLKMITTHFSLTIKERKADHLLTVVEYLLILLAFLLGIVTVYLILRFANPSPLFLQLMGLIPLGLILVGLLPLSFVVFKNNPIPESLKK